MEDIRFLPTVMDLAGVAGFEPALGQLSLVPESKSGALPLGDTPIILPNEGLHRRGDTPASPNTECGG